MSFNELDDLITEINLQVRNIPAHLDWADDVVEKLADALYDNAPMRMHMILNEWGANRYLPAQFIRKLEDAIEQYAFETNSYGI